MKLRFFVLVCICLTLQFCSRSAMAITFSETNYEGRTHIRVETEQATYFYDCAGGGFSRILDCDENDWISFHKEPLSQVPASAAAGFRGLPNLVFGKTNPDAGAGHPGHDRCDSTTDGRDTIRTVSQSGRWAWSWRFSERNAIFTMEKSDAESTWWFLYEGTIGGRWSPNTHFWGADTGGPRSEVNDTKLQLFERWRWAYFGDEQSPRVLLLCQVERDDEPDTLWFMGNSPRGLRSDDGMVVFGFGRGPGGKPLLRGSGHKFVLGFVENLIKGAQSHAQCARIAEQWTEQALKPPNH